MWESFDLVAVNLNYLPQFIYTCSEQLPESSFLSWADWVRVPPLLLPTLFFFLPMLLCLFKSKMKNRLRRIMVEI